MGNQSSGNGRKGSLFEQETPPDTFEIFRKQSIHKSTIVTPNTTTKRCIECELNKSHSLHNLDDNLFQKNSNNSNNIKTLPKTTFKNRRQSTANETLSGSKRSFVPKLSNEIGNTQTSQAPIGADFQENQILNGFDSTVALSRPTLSTIMLNNQRASSSTSNSSAIKKSVKKSDTVAHPISVNGREIIQYCWENAPLDFGTRLCTRIYEKRVDFQKFSQQMGRKQWFEMTHNLQDFLYNVIAKVGNLDVVEKTAKNYGKEHLPLKCYGFKPDFWVTLADLLTVEGVMLDQATHTHTETVTAWSLFVSALFSSIRDGYYTAMREQRNSIRKKSLRQSSGNTLQQLQIPNDGITSSASVSPTSSSNSAMAGKADIPILVRKESSGSNKLEVASSRKSSVASNSGGSRQSSVNDYIAGS